jgi:hypothetical protein
MIFIESPATYKTNKIFSISFLFTITFAILVFLMIIFISDAYRTRILRKIKYKIKIPFRKNNVINFKDPNILNELYDENKEHTQSKNSINSSKDSMNASKDSVDKDTKKQFNYPVLNEKDFLVKGSENLDTPKN